jgi:hypothetical protein
MDDTNEPIDPNQLPEKPKEPSKALVVTEPKELVTVAYNAFVDIHTHYLDYVDPAGNASTSRSGLIIHINKRLNKYIDREHDPINVEQSLLLKALFERLGKIELEAQRTEELRPATKPKLYAAIDLYGPMIEDARDKT